ncbi:fumarylacetoacetate hydrolase family protein [Kiloniella sp. b19]|uniref:fumarylacetoacetate hydrolase family protein n=1 Tax=Kiloniella sp. GXU_MW_B19 TaxID=3141326 RepID=UPI0031D83464
MKLLRYGPAGQEKPGLLDNDGNIRDLSAHLADIDGPALEEDSLNKLKALDPQSLPLVEGTPRLGSPLTRPGKLLGIGLNYSDHAREMGLEPTQEPRLFMKAISSLSGPNDPVEIPRNSTHTDWEVELAVVIGKKAKYVSAEEALSHVAGYAVANDISERHFQNNLSGQWVKGKSHDTFLPLGPWIVTADEVAEPGNLKLWLDVNGERKQDGTTANLIFDLKTIISHVSAFMTLHPGDVILTGTPAGVGLGQKPEPQFLKAGDSMIVSVEGLGEQRQLCIDA